MILLFSIKLHLRSCLKVNAAQTNRYWFVNRKPDNFLTHPCGCRTIQESAFRDVSEAVVVSDGSAVCQHQSSCLMTEDHVNVT